MCHKEDELTDLTYHLENIDYESKHVEIPCFKVAVIN